MGESAQRGEIAEVLPGLPPLDSPPVGHPAVDGGLQLAPEDPFCTVAVDVPAAGISPIFDYAVPATLHHTARPGVRVRVRWRGKLTDAYLIGRSATSDHPGKLQPLARVVSPIPVLTQQLWTVAVALCEQHGHSPMDVLRLAIPPRHAGVEGEQPEHHTLTTHVAGDQPNSPLTISAPAASSNRVERALAISQSADPQGPFSQTPAAAAFLHHVSAGRGPAAAWLAPPGWSSAAAGGGQVIAEADGALPLWVAGLVQVVAACLASGRQALIVVPDYRALAALAPVLEAVWPGQVAAVQANSGPAVRYRQFLDILSGSVNVVVGLRSAVFSPLPNVGLVALWDSADPAMAEPRSPYMHAEVSARAIAERSGAALLYAGHVLSGRVQQYITSAAVVLLAMERSGVRRVMPRVNSADQHDRDPLADRHQLPSAAVQAVKHGLQSGPALVCVAHTGEVLTVRCARCGETARCTHCHDMLRPVGPRGAEQCGACGGLVSAWKCHECAHRQWRTMGVGATRTARDVARLFPGARIQLATGAERVVRWAAGPGDLAVATYGAEPVVAGGYSAVVATDLDVWLHRQHSDAEFMALRAGLGVAALARSGDAGGRVVCAGDRSGFITQVMQRWSVAEYLQQYAHEQAELGLAPGCANVVVTGPRASVTRFVQAVTDASSAEVLGPVVVTAASTLPGAAQSGGARSGGARSGKRASRGQRVAPDGAPSHDAGLIDFDEARVRALLRPRPEHRSLAEQAEFLTKSVELQRHWHVRRLPMPLMQVDPGPVPPPRLAQLSGFGLQLAQHYSGQGRSTEGQ